MNVQDLINVLNSIEDKTLPIRIVDICQDDEVNIWATSVEVSHKGESGYEESGEVRINGSE
jgi:hypothetical protein